jgi:curved DNA-binding protein CbpA
MIEVPSNGNIRDFSLPKVLIYLNRQRLTGTLSVHSAGVTKKAYLKKGDAVFASSTFDDDRLGEMLLKAGRITVEQYDKSVEMLKKSGMRQGAILVKLGFLTPKDLFWGVKYQVRQIIESLFKFEDADYEFKEGDIPEDEVITLKMSMGNLIYDGVKKIENWTRIRNEMPPTEGVLQLNSDPLILFQDIELSQQDKKILLLVDGRRTIKSVMEESWLNSFDALKALYILWSLGIITEKTVEAAPISLDELLEPFTEEEEAFMAKVNTFYDRLGEMNSYEILEIDESAGIGEIRKNYYRFAKEFHPDRFYKSEDSTVKDKLSAIFDAVTDAYNALKEAAQGKEAPAGGKAFMEGAEAAAETGFGTEEIFEIAGQEASAFEEFVREEAPPKKPEEDAGGKFKAGVEDIKKGDFKNAVSLLKDAVSMEPENAEYWSYLALAQSKLPGGFKDAEASMLEAIKIEPSNSSYYANLGLLYLREKQTEDAKMQFEKALMLDPDNQKAKKALSQIN